ncbi:PP2C family protein-serine/threonine phosphatase [Micromonospora sp. NPDC048935]|uniref:PP2C family protein-serine/threonine phosphatase n=1 Tax=Micromonospora sp. NPDC048935 TaxID=3364262 RepID=UPI00371D23E2
MNRPTAIIVADSALRVPELTTALVETGLEARRFDPAELEYHPGLADGATVVLVSASLGLQRVALLSQRLAGLPQRPTVLVFPQGDLWALEACARGGFDYITEPFLPGLLRSRLSTASERGDLLDTVEEMATEASLRAYEQDLNNAREVQAGFLPDCLPTPDGWEVGVRYRPARQVAGDFYDCFELVNGLRLGFLVADVCDKGLSAALFMALIRTLLRHTAEHAGSWNLMGGTPPIALAGGSIAGTSLAPILSVGAGPLLESVNATNRYLARNHLGQGYFVTLFFGVLDPVSGALLFVNGGHNPPVLLRANGGYTLLPPTGPAIGMLANSVYSLGNVRMEPGDTLFVYTDGVVEARSHTGGMFGMPRLLEVLDQPVDSAESLLVAVEGRLDRYVGTADQADDITMLALRRRL